MSFRDAEEQELLALQEQFRSSNKAPAAQVKKSLFKSRAEDNGIVGKGSVREPVHGERVTLDLSDSKRPASASGNPNEVIKDIIEREVAPCQVKAEPVFLAPVSVKPKKINWRDRKNSKLDPNHHVKDSQIISAATPSSDSAIATNDLKSQIDVENTKKLQSMTDVEIEAERSDLLANLDPAVLAVLERRRPRRKPLSSASIEHDPDDFGPSFTSQQIDSVPEVRSNSQASKVQVQVQAQAQASTLRTACNEDLEEYTTAEEAMNSGSDHVHTASCYSHETEMPVHEVESVHFPAQMTNDLDPHSASFLKDLKSKYFAHLDHDPSSLAWMQPPTEAEDQSDYHPSHDSLMPAQLRFDFQGNFLAPRTSREVDADIGLHHHADAPLAAGYTIPELAHLSRSSYPSQACIAIQTLGRLMYKVGKQFYGQEISGKLRSLLETTMVETTLLERARDRHLGVSSYATEALWQANLGREGATYEGQ